MGRLKELKGAIIIIFLVGLVVMYYFYLSNNPPKSAKEAGVQISAVQNVLLRNMEDDYPPSPKEVVKYFAEITQCFYNETYKDKELEKLAFRIRELYDEELVATQSDEDYLEALKADIADFAEKSYTISSYSLSSSVDVEEYSLEGREYAKLLCIFTVLQGTEMRESKERFLLRKGPEGHWKIYGWELDNGTGNE